MSGSVAHRLTTWLALVAAFLLAAAPRQGFVVCFEPDGSVVFESADSTALCGGGDPRTTDDEVPVSLGSLATPCCACVDILVEGSGEDSCAPTRVELRVASSLAVAPAPLPAPAPIRRTFGRFGSEPPRPPGSLAHLRSVVLRV